MVLHPLASCALVLLTLLSQVLAGTCPALSCLSGLIPQHPLDAGALWGFSSFDDLMLYRL